MMVITRSELIDVICLPDSAVGPAGEAKSGATEPSGTTVNVFAAQQQQTAYETQLVDSKQAYEVSGWSAGSGRRSGPVKALPELASAYSRPQCSRLILSCHVAE